ncbi:sugar ABC transporter ATP-binding protein [Aureimonas mangrovi]|uniref:sugar ABC transporter ATP-binding protein n=1 Tax=Aureimonas mangrovi TaxID=2758041 RepID=UPI001FE998F8|nr:sugar ABC transporter ATP-binding protein [Aureimonas mangrovi]
MLALRGVGKDFGPVTVLEGIDIDLVPGELHALIGENGAGKSTLMKILSGYERATRGAVELDGTPVSFASNLAAEAAGIVLVHQEFALAEQLSVAANIFLGREIRRGLFLDRRTMHEASRQALEELDTALDPRTRVADLSVSDKQRVEIAKAVSRNLRVLILDEPTAVLTPREAQALFRIVAKLKAAGVAILFTSHKLDEVRALSDRITVLRDGRHVATRPGGTLDEHQMAGLMVGRELSDLFPPKVPPRAGAPVMLSARGVDVPGRVTNGGFELRAGEVLGFAGLVGAGRTELLEAVCGLRHRTGGTIEREGREVRIRRFEDAVALKIAYVTEDRKGRGLLLRKGLRENLTLLALDRFSRGFVDRGAEEKALDEAITRFDIRVRDRTVQAGQLSGGNQQKLLLAKTMLSEPEVVIFDEPTRGIDVGTKQEIYRFVAALAAEGKAVIVVSSELPEIVGLCHRVIVMRSGRMVGEVSGADINEDEIVKYATGVKTMGESDVDRAA